MGKKDVLEKSLLAHNDVFASLWNAFAPENAQICPEFLRDAPTEYQHANTREMRRDIVKIYNNALNIGIAFMGLENQTRPDPHMVIRVMGYDWAIYEHSMRHRRPLLPVFTTILYFGYKKRWTGAKKLSELVTIPTGMARLFKDYEIRVIELAWLADEDIGRLSGDLKILALELRMLRKTGELAQTDIVMQHVEELLELLKLITGNTDLDTIEIAPFKQEEKTMANLMAQYNQKIRMQGLQQGLALGESQGFEKGKSQGLEIGRSQGLEIGGANEKIETVKRMLRLNLPIGDIQKISLLPMEKIMDIKNHCDCLEPKNE